MKNQAAFVLLGLLIPGVCGCYYDNMKELYPATGTCRSDTVTYRTTVQPLVQRNCALSGCHDAGTAAAGVNLSNYTGLQSIAGNGKLLGVITHSSGYSPMPKNSAKLDDCAIAQLQKWVADGAPEN